MGARGYGDGAGESGAINEQRAAGAKIKRRRDRQKSARNGGHRNRDANQWLAGGSSVNREASLVGAPAEVNSVRAGLGGVEGDGLGCCERRACAVLGAGGKRRADDSKRNRCGLLVRGKDSNGGVAKVVADGVASAGGGAGAHATIPSLRSVGAMLTSEIGRGDERKG